MAEKDVAAPGSMRPPAGPPPSNHGRTTAAWTTTWVVVAGVALASLALVLALGWLFWTGIAIAVAGPVLGKVMSLMGLGQPRSIDGAAPGDR
jgi:hypothetical protein